MPVLCEYPVFATYPPRGQGRVAKRANPAGRKWPLARLCERLLALYDDLPGLSSPGLNAPLFEERDMPSINRRALMISSGWIQAAVIVLLIGFFIMAVLTYYTYSDEPPIPEVVKDASGAILFTHADVMAGQGIFLRNGLMEYGSVFGHGGYLGPDFTAEYLHRAALASIAFYVGANSDTARTRTIEDFKANRYDKTSGVLVYTDSQVNAFEQSRTYYAAFFGEPTTRFGLRPGAIRDPREIRQLVAFFSWSAWAASAARQPFLLLHQQLATRAARR